MEELKNLSMEEVKNLITEYQKEEKKIDYNDENWEFSERYKEIEKILYSDEARVFKCEECGEMWSYFEIQDFASDFEKNIYVCVCCYENEMGEDL